MTESFDQTAPDFKKARRTKDVPVDLSKLDRLPPHSTEAEQGVLGCCLLSPVESLGLCMERLDCGADAFYDLRHQAIFRQLTVMWDRSDPIDLITVQQGLKDSGQLEHVGGLAYISSLVDSVPSAANLPYYLDMLREKYRLRRLLSVCTQAIGQVHEHCGEVDALLDSVERDVMGITQKHATSTQKTLTAFVREFIDRMEIRSRGELIGLSTGFTDLDNLIGGLEDSTVAVIAARPSVGKTAFAMNIVENIALAGHSVGVFSLEMPGWQLIERIAASISKVNLRNTASWNNASLAKIADVAKRISKTKLQIDDRSGITVRDIRAKARRWKREHKIRVLVVDYLQLISPLDRTRPRQQQIGEISNGLKQLAKELEIPVVVLAQLNRELEKDKGRKPRMSDLRESGDIEQDADVIGMLYRPPAEDDEDENPNNPEHPVNLLIAKQRNGPAGVDVRLLFRKQFTRFEGISKIQA